MREDIIKKLLQASIFGIMMGFAWSMGWEAIVIGFLALLVRLESL